MPHSACDDIGDISGNAADACVYICVEFEVRKLLAAELRVADMTGIAMVSQDSPQE